MARGRRYKRRQRYINFILFYLTVVILFFVNYTFSRYTGTTTSTITTAVAKFNVKVNGIAIGTNTLFNLRLSSTNSNTLDNKIAPSLENEYFEIEIDPTGTEVSIDYRFNFDLSKLKNIKITKYSVDNGASFKDVTGNIITDSILLVDQTKGFTEDQKVTLRVYWEWNEEIVNPDPTSIVTDVPVTAIVSQKIS